MAIRAVALLLAVALAAVLLRPAAAFTLDIECQVCERMAREISEQVAKKQQALPPSKNEIIKIAENVCNPAKQEGDWILRTNIVQKGDELELVKKDRQGRCINNCTTIKRACERLANMSVEYVANMSVDTINPSVDQLMENLCIDLSKACKNRFKACAEDRPPVPKVSPSCKDRFEACAEDRPPVPKDQVPEEPVEKMPSKDEKIYEPTEGSPGNPSMKTEDNSAKNVQEDKGYLKKYYNMLKKWLQGWKKPAKSGKSKTDEL